VSVKGVTKLKIGVEAVSTDVTYEVKLRISKPTVTVEVKS